MSRIPSYWQLVRHNREFRFLWIGIMVSFFGDWFTTIALYSMMQVLSDSATAVTGVLVAKTLPIFLMVPIAGPLVDRFDRRTILLWTVALRALLTIGLVMAWGAGSLVGVFAVEVVRAAVGGVFIPCREAALPQVVADRELAPASALNGGSWSVMLALGAAVGGVVTQWLGVTGALWVDVGTFVVAGMLLAQLPTLPPTERATSAPVRFVDGLHYLRGKGALVIVLATKSGNAVGGAAVAAIPFYGNGLYAPLASAGFVGMLYAFRGLGAMVGSMGIRRVVGDSTHALQRSIGPLFLVQMGSYVALALAPSMAWAAVAFVAIGISAAGVWVFSTILAQRVIDGPVRGRIFALEFGLMTLVSSGSSLGAGLAMDLLGWSIRDVIWAVAATVSIPAVLAFVLWSKPLVINRSV